MTKVITCRIDDVFEEKLRNEAEKSGVSFSSYVGSILSSTAGNLKHQSDENKIRFDEIEADIKTLNTNIRIAGNLSAAVLKVLEPDNANEKIKSIISSISKEGE